VGADVASLFENVDAFGRKLGFGARFIVPADKSSQVQGASETSRPSADDQDVRVQPLAFGAHTPILARKLLEDWLQLLLFEGFGERRNEFENVSDDAVIGDLEYRRVLVLVDGHDGARTLHPHDVLDGAADAQREI